MTTTTTPLQHEERQHQGEDGPSSKPSSSSSLHRQRLRILHACQACRLRKVKCDGGSPVCARCQRIGKTCTYNSRDSVKRKAPLGHAQPPPIRSRAPPVLAASPPALRAHSLEALSTSTSPTDTPSTIGPSSRSEQQHLDEDHEDPDPDQNRAYYTAHGRFAGLVAAAIDARAGLAPAATSNLVPFVDAPLFGEIDLHSPYSIHDFATELPPPRADTDRLVGIYWQYVDPVEPILDRDRFLHNYEALYSRPGALSHADRDVWPSILNVVFALAMQRQESIPLQKRDAEGNRYFQRAWALLRPETILWKPASLELVQCLMLMNRYLHCTNNQHKTWMTAGLAMRIAQSMCCHLPEASSAKESCNDRDRQLRKKVWASCVALDRCVSWSLGRTSAPSLISLPHRTGSIPPSGSYQQVGSRHAEHFTRGLELYEIGSQIQLAQTQTRNSLAARLGLPRLYQQDEYHAVAVQLDSCLNKWENNLLNDWKLQDLQNVVDRTSRVERYLLRLRLLHSRIFLYRPMLARFYSMKSHTATAQAPSSHLSLSDRLLREGAAMCVETAQKVTSLVIETLEPDEPMGLLPWWYRIYYLHIAGTNFLAAMFGSELFTESVAQSWDSVMSALRAHEHLSTYVQQCIRTFETLSTRILQTRHHPNPAGCGGNVPPEEGTTSGFYFDDIFQDGGLDFDSFLFGMEDVTEGQR